MRLGSLKEGPRLDRQKETLTGRKAEEIRTNTEGKCRNPKRRQKRYQSKVEAVDKTRIEDKREAKTKEKKVELRERPCAWGSYVLRVELGVYEGGTDYRIILETMEVPKREHEAKSNGDRDGNQT